MGKLVHFQKFEDFQKDYESGEIKFDDLVFIKDTKTFWTHDTIYGAGPDDYISKEELEKAIDDLCKQLNSTPSEIVANIKSGGSVVLRKDLKVPDNKSLTMTKDVEVDLKNNSIGSYGGTRGDTIEIQKATVVLKNGIVEAPENQGDSGAVIAVMGNSNVTLENITINGSRCILNSASNNNIVIKSGTYTSPTSAECVYYSAGTNSKIIIEGGRFESEPYNGVYYTLNIKDSLITEGVDVRDFIEVRGGEFVNFNPANCNSEGPGTNFVAEGKTVQQIIEGSNTIYKVV